jgi:hypothetical protein
MKFMKKLDIQLNDIFKNETKMVVRKRIQKNKLDHESELSKNF